MLCGITGQVTFYCADGKSHMACGATHMKGFSYCMSSPKCILSSTCQTGYFVFRLNFCLPVKFPGLWRASLWLEIELLFSPHPKVWKYLLFTWKHRRIDYVFTQIFHLRTYVTVKCQQNTCTVNCYYLQCWLWTIVEQSRRSGMCSFCTVCVMIA